MKLILDSGGVSHLAERSPLALALLRELTASEFWPPIVPTVVLVECLSGRAGLDAPANRDSDDLAALAAEATGVHVQAV